MKKEKKREKKKEKEMGQKGRKRRIIEKREKKALLRGFYVNDIGR